MVLTSKDSKKTQCLPWLKLILSVIPSLVFGVFTVVFTLQQNAFSQATRAREQEQELQQRKQAIFDSCINAVSDLLISPYFNRSDIRHLRPVREKVLTALRQIDATQKRDIILFLYTNELIQTNIPSEYRLDLRGADLTNVHFIKSSTIRCDLPNLSLRGVLASNIIFSGCYLQNVDFGESVMDDSLFDDSILAFGTLEDADLTRATFHKCGAFKLSLAGASLVQSTFTNMSRTLSINLTNTNLFESSITSKDLFGILPDSGNSTNIILNTRFPNGSFLIDRSQLVINGGAEEECNATSNMTKHWLPSVDIADMQTYKQEKNSSVYPPAAEGNCYFVAEKVSAIVQNVDVSRFSTLIDSGQALGIISAYVGCSVARPKDEGLAYIGYFDAGNLPIILGPVIETRNKPFEFQSQNGSIPIGTRTIRFYIVAGIDKLMNTTMPQYCVFDDVKLFISNRNPDG